MELLCTEVTYAHPVVVVFPLNVELHRKSGSRLASSLRKHTVGGASPLYALEFRPIGPHLAPGIMKNERKMRGETQPPGHYNKFPIGEKVNKANSTVPVFCFCFCLQNKHRRRRHKIPKAFAVSSPVSLFISQSISERRTRTCCLIADDVEKVEDRCHRVP